ncbi:hypothetical protein WI71_23675 [Burkholderia diffusa]|nr:hypothetical protein WI71_23675 [Burkholderia diffusa]
MWKWATAPSVPAAERAARSASRAGGQVDRPVRAFVNGIEPGVHAWLLAVGGRGRSGCPQAFD